MKARDVIRPNSDADYWDVPKSDMMIRRYRVIGGPMIYEVIEPSSLMGPHGEIMSLWDGQTHEYYGTVSTRMFVAEGLLDGATVAEYGGHYKTWLWGLWEDCYQTIARVIGFDVLLAGEKLRHNIGRLEVLGR